jgi:hypothetical protein
MAPEQIIKGICWLVDLALKDLIKDLNENDSLSSCLSTRKHAF